MYEPAEKKIKLDNDPKIRAILSEEFIQDISLTQAIISHIADKRHISSVMKELSENLPLKPSLQHLKRVRQREVLICAAAEMPECRDVQGIEESLRVYLESMGCSEDIIKILCVIVMVQEVPASPIRLRWQYEAMQKYWPCKFHPNAYLESLYNCSNFSVSQSEFHQSVAELAVSLSYELEAERPVGICIDPRTHAIVALAASSSVSLVMHCSMVLIDLVARTQNAGAWNSYFKKEKFIEDAKKSDNSTQITMRGIENRYYNYIENKFPNNHFKFGAELLNENSKDFLRKERVVNSTDNLSRFGPYLCTGYDVYLSQEPCLMCSMALVHSRVKRIFYVYPSTNGALCSRFKLQAIQELNHHYEVFQCKVNQQDFNSS